MDFKQAIELSKLAKVAGFGLAVESGKVQFQTVTYNPDHTSTVIPKSEWLNYSDALKFIKG